MHVDRCASADRATVASQNAATLSAEALQTLMRHESYATTRLYINNFASKISESVKRLHVPAILRGAIAN